MACCDSAENILKSTCNVKHIYQYVFNSISCNEIGGILSVFQLYTMRKIYEQHILENNIEYMHENIRQGLLIADVVVGRLVASNNLTVTNENNQFLLNDQGAYLNNASMVFTRGNNSITIDPNVGLSFKRGSEEVIKMDLQTGNGIFSGEIRGGSININNRFRVDANGNATMEYADIRGGEIRLGNTIITEDDFRSRNAYFEDSIMDDSCEYWGEIDGSQITRDSINANRIMAGSITANEISTSYMRAIRIDGDQIRANSITADQIDASFIDAIEIRAESIISGTLYGMDIEWPGGSLRLGVGSDGINRTTVVWLKSQYTVGIKISSGAGLSLEAENGIWISGWDKDLERTLMEFDSRLTSLEWRV